MATEEERREQWRGVSEHFARLSAVVSASIRDAQQAMGTLQALVNGASMATDAARPAYDDLATVVREVAAAEYGPFISDDIGGANCIFCGVSDLPEPVQHEKDCLYERARALAARLPPEG